MRLSDLHWIDAFVSFDDAIDELIRTLQPGQVQGSGRDQAAGRPQRSALLPRTKLLAGAVVVVAIAAVVAVAMQRQILPSGNGSAAELASTAQNQTSLAGPRLQSVVFPSGPIAPTERPFAPANQSPAAPPERDPIASPPTSGPQTTQPLSPTAIRCQQLWVQRNQIFKEHGSCFKTRPAIDYFGNAGCLYDTQDAVPIPAPDRVRISQLLANEQVLNCAQMVSAPQGGNTQLSPPQLSPQ